MFAYEEYLLNHGISEGYRRNNDGHWRKYVSFCHLYGLQAVPADESKLCLYTTYRAWASNICAASLKNELYGIRSVHIDNGYNLDIRASVMTRLARLRSGFRKVQDTIKAQRQPITDDVLSKFLLCLDHQSYDSQTHRALLCFAKFGLLRVSEYTYGNNGNRPKIGNIRIIPDMIDPMYLVYYFTKSKTNQYGDHERVVCICNCPGPCAVHEVARMLDMRGQYGPDDDLFWYSNGQLPTAKGVNNLIKNLCTLCGLSTSAFRSHQLRSGGVVDLLAIGVPDSVIQFIARWKNLNSMVPYKKLSAENVVKIVSDKLKTNK